MTLSVKQGKIMQHVREDREGLLALLELCNNGYTRISRLSPDQRAAIPYCVEEELIVNCHGRVFTPFAFQCAQKPQG